MTKLKESPKEVKKNKYESWTISEDNELKQIFSQCLQFQTVPDTIDLLMGREKSRKHNGLIYQRSLQAIKARIAKFLHSSAEPLKAGVNGDSPIKTEAGLINGNSLTPDCSSIDNENLMTLANTCIDSQLKAESNLPNGGVVNGQTDIIRQSFMIAQATTHYENQLNAKAHADNVAAGNVAPTKALQQYVDSLAKDIQRYNASANADRGSKNSMMTPVPSVSGNANYTYNNVNVGNASASVARGISNSTMVSMPGVSAITNYMNNTVNVGNVMQAESVHTPVVDSVLRAQSMHTPVTVENIYKERKSRRPKYSREENEEVMQLFSEYFTLGRCPGKKEIELAFKRSRENNGKIHLRSVKSLQNKLYDMIMLPKSKISESANSVGHIGGDTVLQQRSMLDYFTPK